LIVCNEWWLRFDARNTSFFAVVEKVRANRPGLSKLLRFDRNDGVGQLVGFEITNLRRVRKLWGRTPLECSPARLKHPSLRTTWHWREIFSTRR